MGGARPVAERLELDETATRIPEAIDLFTAHVETRSPAEPRTLERYKEVLNHFERLLGKKKYLQAINRVDIDDYKNARSKESKGKGKVITKVAASTINFEVTIFADDKTRIFRSPNS